MEFTDDNKKFIDCNYILTPINIVDYWYLRAEESICIAYLHTTGSLFEWKATGLQAWQIKRQMTLFLRVLSPRQLIAVRINKLCGIAWYLLI